MRASIRHDPAQVGMLWVMCGVLCVLRSEGGGVSLHAFDRVCP